MHAVVLMALKDRFIVKIEDFTRSTFLYRFSCANFSCRPRS